ncbi:MAG: hypothetical protein Q4A01_07715 [Coriobacteriales bacterium]|nr:hypothetical protein [Coriobacteriales bacterium]
MADGQLKDYARIVPNPSDMAIPRLDLRTENALNGLPFEPWRGCDQDEEERPVRQHGDALMGVFISPRFDCLRLFVEDPPDCG